MSKLNKKDRASLCLFTFSDGRRCRTPRLRNHPHFCFDHAQKEARARAAQTIGKDLAYFFSGDYLSACDLSTALARILPAVVRGDIKPKTARTVAYLAQTLLQSIRLAQHEYIEALSTNRWRNAIANSVNENRDYRFPPAPAPKQPAPPTPAPAPPPTAVIPNPVASSANGGEGSASPSSVTHQPASASSTNPPPQPIATPANCHSACPDLVGERSEESAFSPTSAPASQTPASTSNVTHPLPAAQPAPPVASTLQPVNPPQPRPSAPPPPPAPPDRSAPWLDFRNITSLRPDSKLL